MVRRVIRLTVVLAAAGAIFGAFSATALAGNVSITVSPSGGGTICATYDHYTTAGFQWDGTYQCPLTTFNLSIYGDPTTWWIYHFTPTPAAGYSFVGWQGDCLGLGVCDYDSRVPSSSATAVFAPTASTLAAKLVSDTDKLKPGTALTDKAAPAQLSIGYIAQHLVSDNYFFCNNFGAMKGTQPAADTATACADITNLLGLVKAQTGKKLSSAQASLLTSDASNLAAALGCS